MRATGRWDDEAEQAAADWCSAEIDRAVAGVAAVGAAEPALLFDNVYADEPPQLAAQRAELLRDLSEGARP